MINKEKTAEINKMIKTLNEYYNFITDLQDDRKPEDYCGYIQAMNNAKIDIYDLTENLKDMLTYLK